jgi:hypothetical protein
MFKSVFVADLFEIRKKFYQIDIDVSCDKNVLKDSNCVLGIFFKLIPKYRNFFKCYKRFLVISFNKVNEIEIKWIYNVFNPVEIHVQLDQFM